MTTTRKKMRRELAHRSSASIDVTLLWNEASGELTVTAYDSSTGERLELPARCDKALDVFNHPFAYTAERAGSADEPALGA